MKQIPRIVIRDYLLYTIALFLFVVLLEPFGTRNFLANINFITQISGNSAGYKVNMFSTDKVLPVSKANVATFREKIKELGKQLG